MNKNEFIKRVVDELETRLGNKAEIQVNQVLKNNGITYNGIIIKEGNTNVYPNIYIDDIYNSYEEKENYNISQACDTILKIHKNSSLGAQIEKDFFTNFDDIRDNIVMKLINYDKNKKYLENHVHKRIYDLAIVFYYIFETKDARQASIFIQNKYCKIWNIDVEELYEVAYNNTFNKFPVYIESMEDKIASVINMDADELFGKGGEDGNILDADAKGMMYVIGNSNDVNGAISFLANEKLDEFSSEIDSSFYILPSSIHELILVPSETNLDASHYLELVRSTNKECLDDEDFLSDNVYFYNKSSNTIEYICS